MIDIEKLRKDRMQIMHAIYEASGGSENVKIAEADLKERLKLSHSEISRALEYLHGEDLIVVTTITHPATEVVLHSPWRGVPSRDHPSSFHTFTQGPWTETYARITHRGVKAVEQSLQGVSHEHGVLGHAFLSYVREDAQAVDQLQQVLEAAGIRVWRDTADLWPGQNWHSMIRRAITAKALVFIACFSQNSASRERSYQNEELTLAIEQLRQRRPDDSWLIPVRFDDCVIPDWDIGGGRTFSSIQRADLFGDHADKHMARLVSSILRILGRTNPGRE